VRFTLGASTRGRDEPLECGHAWAQQLALEQRARWVRSSASGGVVLQRVLDEEILEAAEVGVVDIAEAAI
jgi:hypothetical protein